MGSLVLVFEELTVLQEKSHQVRKTKIFKERGDTSARASLLEGERALCHVLGSGKGMEQRVRPGCAPLGRWEVREARSAAAVLRSCW